MRKLLLATAFVLMMVLPVMAQPVDYIRADSVQYSNPYLTSAPYIAGGTNYTGEIKLTISISPSVGELKTWGYAIMPNTWNNIGQNYNGQLFELGGEANLAQWIHYFYSNRDMTILANARELQAKILGWAYYDGNNVLQGPNTYQPLGFPPVLYEGNINDLYGHANAWGGTIFIYRKDGTMVFPPARIQDGARFERRDFAAEYNRPPEMRLAFQGVNSNGTPITLNQVESVYWVEKRSFAQPFPTTDKMYQATISYNTNTRFWNPIPTVGSFMLVSEMHYRWLPIPIDIALNEVATFEIKLKDGQTLVYPVVAPPGNPGTPVIPSTIVKSLVGMPAIPATFNQLTYNILKEKDKKSGKIVVKAEQITETVNNITVRTIEDPAGGTALVIQWPEPDIALFGGADMSPTMCKARNGSSSLCDQYQVKVRLGAQTLITQTPNGPEMTEVFLWIDVPAQMGTVVVDAPTLEALEVALISQGFTLNDLTAMIVYREMYTIPGVHPSDPSLQGPISYVNRAQSLMVPVPVIP